MRKGYVWITVLLFLVTLSETVASGCTRCSDFNKYNNPEVKCPSIPQQCGDCYIGFRKTVIPDDGSCEKILPPVLKQQPPSTVYVSEGHDVNLTCKFRPRDTVDCVWMRRGFHLEVSNRYTYTASQGVNTHDCSITIKNFQSTDVGEWQCGSLADSNSDGVMSENITLALKERLIVSPISRNVTLNDTITLNCTFDQEVECVWLRRGFHLEISNRYAFTSKEQRKMAKDCSITITNFSRGDGGTWQCGSMADSKKEGILSKTAVLTIVTNETTSQNPPSTARPKIQDPATETKVDEKLPAAMEKQYETTPSQQTIITETTSTSVSVSAIDPVLVTFIVSIILLVFVIIIGVPILVHYIHKDKEAKNTQKNIDSNEKQVKRTSDGSQHSFDALIPKNQTK